MKILKITMPCAIFARASKTVLIMKLTFILLVLCFVNVSASIFSQNIDLSRLEEPVTINDLLKEIEKQSEFHFFYHDDLMDVNQEVKLNYKNATMKTILDDVLKKSDATYKIMDNKLIIITPRENLQQELKITGSVISHDGDPLAGVNVVIKGTMIGTVTDNKGNFTITVRSANDVLQISYVGFLTEEVAVAGQTIINVTLVPDIADMEQVVVIGYGTQKKSDITGSVAKITSDEILKTPNIGFDQALQGRASGVYVTQSSGRPGAPISVKVRGIGTINNSEPLYVIDGIPIVNDIDPGGEINSLVTLNPDDVESIEILKDASATAIYGARGANGVVLITTKRGAAGESKLSLSSYYGKSYLPKKYDLLNSEEYAQFYRELYTLNDQADRANIATALDLYDEKKEMYDTDWQDEITRIAPVQNHNLTFSGGREFSNYSFSGSYFKQEGIIIGSEIERISIRANSDFQIKKRIKIGESILLSKVEQRNEELGFFEATRVSPLLPVYDPDNLGGYAGPGGETTARNDMTNPVAINNLTDEVTDMYRMMANLYAELEIFNGFSYRINAGSDYTFHSGEGFTPRYDLGIRSRNLETLTKSSREKKVYLIEHLLKYTKTLDNHDFTILGGHTYQYYINENWSAVTDSVVEFTVIKFSGLENKKTSVNDDMNEWAMISYLGRFLYSYKDKYLLTASLRRDGSSRFGSNKRWGNFPSFSVGWKFSKEEFMSNIGFLSSGKLRFSWGKTGNQEIKLYAPYSQINTDRTYYVFGTSQETYFGAAPDMFQKGNKDIQWETTIQQNYGIDLYFLNNKLGLNIDYYIKKTDDMLMPLPTSSMAGVLRTFGDPWINIGRIDNKGLELNLTYRKLEGEFNYSVTANGSILRNKVVDLDDKEYRRDYTNTAEGHTIGSFYGFIIDEMIQDTLSGEKPGTYKMKDLNQDGRITEDDQTFIGKSIPDFVYGLSFDCSYKIFDFSMFLYGIQGVHIYNDIGIKLGSPYNLHNELDQNKLSSVLDYWKPETNEGSDVPFPTVNEPDPYIERSTLWLENGSFLRIKNMQLGISLPDKTLNKLNLDKLRFYIAIQNLYTFTKYSGLEPEVGSESSVGWVGDPTLNNGIDKGTFPQARTFMIGLQLEL
jgi:TonB-linked SusC/RagA family outer membrane protein